MNEIVCEFHIIISIIFRVRIRLPQQNIISTFQKGQEQSHITTKRKKNLIGFGRQKEARVVEFINIICIYGNRYKFFKLLLCMNKLLFENFISFTNSLERKNLLHQIRKKAKNNFLS